MDVFRRLRGFYLPYMRYLVLSIVMLVLTTALGLVYPYLLKQIVDRVIIGREYRLLLPYLGLILAAAVVKGAFNFGQQYLGQVFGMHAAYDLRNALYKKLNRQPFSYYDRVHTGDLMSRMTADLDAFRQFLAFGFNNLVNFVLLTSFGLALMCSLNAWLTAAILVLLPVLGWIAVRFDSLLWPAYKRVRKTLGALNTAVQENIMGMRTVKSFAREGYELGKFDGRNEAYYASNLAAADLWKRFFPYMELIGNLEVCIVLFVGGWLVIRGDMDLGDLVAFFSILWYITFPMSQLGYLLNNWTQSVAAGERLLEILEAENPITSPVASYRGKMRGRVEFRGVRLVQDGQEVLRDIDFTVEPGQTIALLGKTGAGKSSIVNLIPRFYDVTEGSVLVDGIDVRDWDLDALRRQVAVVFQESFLFSTTIFANIAYGKPDATMEEVARAARIADAAEFIEQLPDGYRTIVGERGLGLSGGQKQRIALARAILADPAILILDDATSAVDMETEYTIQQALQEVMRGRTTFVIAHRISTLKRADQILVIDGGRIVERGTHDELVRQDGLYREIFEMQFRDRDEFSDDWLRAAVNEQRGVQW
ncbi:putative ABC transporter ATP-binding protein YknU [Alicyclobacillus cellulosilyticus]|uniref:ABC transporter ATP-binding protein YknU n=1 Tax=Alicyclobacillus cellulosilyticus TaxID=1003997 RepID=A0A917NHA7_9BACL|nr:ABC transporter ATP-binding protein [Alicyclobacillus cellulosilyticus]GGI97930.1 putative ABC transporter ATP-binding protein YknU [Alicyclobacillus cellulosilyticus]